MERNLSKEQAISLAKKALKDIGHWENFKIENANYIERRTPNGYYFWLVSFNFTENDWNDGKVTPIITVNDEEQLVTFISWKKGHFLLTYDADNDKYFHPTLSREQPEI